MFDGAELSLAYGASYDPYVPTAPVPQATQVAPPPPPVVQSIADPAATSHAMAPDVAYNPPSSMYATQSAAPKTALPMLASGPGFWDKVGSKKGEIIKLVGLALVVLLAISLDKVATHYLTGYISKSFLTDMQELLVRISYPVIVLLLLWLLKALV